jgi:hypothetical protein
VYIIAVRTSQFDALGTTRRVPTLSCAPQFSDFPHFVSGVRLRVDHRCACVGKSLELAYTSLNVHVITHAVAVNNIRSKPFDVYVGIDCI